DQFFDSSFLPNKAPDAFRRNANGDFLGEDFQWLAREYVVTPDDARAARIMAVLEDASDAPYIRGTAEGGSYLTRIPPDVRPRNTGEPFMRNELHRLLRLARDQHKAAMGKPVKRNQAAQIGG